MRVSVVQMSPGHNKAENISQAACLIDGAVTSDRPDMLGLPEIWTCLGGDRAAKFEQAESLPPPDSNEPGGPAYEFLRGIARERRIHVHGGSIAERVGEKLFNTTLVFDQKGHEIARYRKIHLFDITTPDGAGYHESETFGAGEKVVTCDACGVRIGLAICYDLRFPELFSALRRAGAEVIFLPAAFTRETGKDHWEVLVRARAIETQCWLAAPACYGKHLDANGVSRWTYGHSILCDPWGHVVAKASDGVGWATARIDQQVTARVRCNMPILEHHRLI